MGIRRAWTQITRDFYATVVNIIDKFHVSKCIYIGMFNGVSLTLLANKDIAIQEMA